MPEAVIVVTARTPSDRLNVNGGAIAVSHPFGMIMVLDGQVPYVPGVAAVSLSTASWAGVGVAGYRWADPAPRGPSWTPSVRVYAD